MAWRWICGRHAVEETLRARSRGVRELWVLTGSEGGHIRDLVDLARGAGAKVRWVSKAELDRIASGGAHQGLGLRVGERPAPGLDELLQALPAERRKAAILLALDQIQDPQNLGAIARAAACLGAEALLVPERRAAPVTQAALQSSAGAIEKIPVITVGNLSQNLERLKQEGFWIYGADMAGKPCWETRFNRPLVLVIGSEGSGMRALVRDRCDELVSVPQAAQGVASLNASAAAAVLLYEACRQAKG
ncbi:MAG: 23S rRNA (guanosine(2251)-2'-O)-methyltransferase RlmB [Elusimicrobia bacterium]|nr:23S rRNA (guanosine(2251)-2'-O)-methyltransferase RlmB [Elusimicrobiota bacterium]